MSAIGKTRWSIAGGLIELRSTGTEPAMTSRDELRLLNTGDDESQVTITVFYSDRDPIGRYEVTVQPRRVRSVRVNDLIDPLPVPLATAYSLLIESSVPIVVQFTRVDTSAAARAICGTTAYAEGRG